jgi:perosamine synthetase
MNAIPVNQPLFCGNEKKYLLSCIKTGWISSEGPFVSQFEEQFSKRVRRTYGVAVSSGSAALDVAVTALGITKGDEVIMPAFTIISCALSVVRAGAIPVLVDSDPVTWNMDVTRIEKKITKKTKAIMAVHIYGLPVDMDPVLRIAKKYNLKVIEDAAEMHGQTYKKKPCGSFGDISIFSFYPNKHVTTGEGGMVVTDSPEIDQRCRSLRNLCFDKERRYIHQEMGWNYRMTNMQAALGVAQLEQLDMFIKRKRRIGKMYSEGLKHMKGLQLPLQKTTYADNIYWVYGVVLGKGVPFDATEVMKRLGQKAIGTRHFFYPMHKQPVFLKMGFFKNESHPISEYLSERGFYIPCGLAITDKQIERVIKTVREVCS